MARVRGVTACVDQPLVEVERVGPDVHEHRHRAAQHEGVGGGNEGEGRHDHLVPGLEVAQDRRHLQRGGAGMREQRAFRAEVLLEPLVALAGEAAVPRQMPVAHRGGDVLQLGADGERLVERDLHPNTRDS